LTLIGGYALVGKAVIWSTVKNQVLERKNTNGKYFFKNHHLKNREKSDLFEKNWIIFGEKNLILGGTAKYLHNIGSGIFLILISIELCTSTICFLNW
jgi:hypothetical protein